MINSAAKILTVTVMVALLTGCPHKSRKGGGGVDGGGGNPILSTREEVIKAVTEMWERLIQAVPENPLVTACSPLDNIYAWGEEPELNTQELRDGKRVHTMLYKILSIPKKRALWDWKFPDLAIGRELGPKKLQLLEKGLCYGSGHGGTTASVSKLDLSGEICVSIEGLQKTANASLKRDALALLVHEIAHLYGYGEDDAELLQNYFLKHMDSILRTDGKKTRANLKQTIDRLMWSWFKLIRYDVLDGSFRGQIYAKSELVDVILDNLPGSYGDDIKVSKPELETKAHEALVEALGKLAEFRVPWERSKDWKPIPVTEDILLQIRGLLLSLLDAQLALNEFVGPGGHVNRLPSREFLIKATNPAAIKDPKLRVDTSSAAMLAYLPTRPGTMGWGRPFEKEKE